MISIIVALARNRAIGLNGNLIWHLSADLKYFKRVTTGHTVIMGYKTFLSLPNQRALPNRRNIIISSHLEQVPEGFELVHSIQETVNMVHDEEETFVIGGGSIYEQFLPHADKLYLTRIDKEFEADTYFPYIDFDEWNLIDVNVVDEDPQVDFTYRFEVWERK